MRKPFKRQSHKMVKHIQTLKLFECDWPFCDIGN